jgi:phospholipid N-methyltransferase
MDQSGGIIHDEISAKKVPEEKLEIIEILKKFSAATDKKKQKDATFKVVEFEKRPYLMTSAFKREFRWFWRV